MAKIIKFPTEKVQNKGRSSLKDSSVNTVTSEKILTIPSQLKDLPTFRMFVTQVELENWNEGAKILAVLFNISADEALACTKHFHKRLQLNGELSERLISLKEIAMHAGSNDILMLLAMFFGLQGSAAINVLNFLKS